MKVLNAFSLSMLPPGAERSVFVKRVSCGEARGAVLDDGFVESYVGHADVALVFTNELCLGVPANRANAVLVPGERALVGQYTGPRLPEGTRCLPEGARIEWMIVSSPPRNSAECVAYAAWLKAHGAETRIRWAETHPVWIGAPRFDV